MRELVKERKLCVCTIEPLETLSISAVLIWTLRQINLSKLALVKQIKKCSTKVRKVQVHTMSGSMLERKSSGSSVRMALLVLWLAAIIYVNHKHQSTTNNKTQQPHTATATTSGTTGTHLEALDGSPGELPAGFVPAGLWLFAEAGKKKKKEKSEVVVISVNNPQGRGGHGYPIYIPSCGGGMASGFGRRKRSVVAGIAVAGRGRRDS